MQTKTNICELIELGRFEDLSMLIDLLNETFDAYQYRLERVKKRRDYFLFIEDKLADDEYSCGIVIKKHGKVYALSEAVYDMIMSAYKKYSDKAE